MVFFFDAFFDGMFLRLFFSMGFFFDDVFSMRFFFEFFFGGIFLRCFWQRKEGNFFDEIFLQVFAVVFFFDDFGNARKGTLLDASRFASLAEAALRSGALEFLSPC